MMAEDAAQSADASAATIRAWNLQMGWDLPSSAELARVCTLDDCDAEAMWVPACAVLDPTSVLHDAPCTPALLDSITGEAWPSHALQLTPHAWYAG